MSLFRQRTFGGGRFGLGNPLQYPAGSLPATTTSRWMASVTASGTQAVNDTTTTYLSYDTVIQASNGMFNTTAGDRIVIPIAGLYLCTCLVVWEANATGTRSTALSAQTAAAVELAASVDVRGAVSGTGTAATLVGLFSLDVGNIVRVRVIQTSTVQLLVTSSAPSAMLSVAWFGRVP